MSGSQFPKINRWYQDDFQRVLRDNLLSEESILWAGNVGQVGKDSSGRIGYLLVTEQRLICVLFRPDDSFNVLGALAGIATLGLLDSPTYNQKRQFIRMRAHNTFLVEPPSYPLTETEKYQRTTIEKALRNVASVQRGEIQRASVDEEQPIVELTLQFIPDGSLRIAFYDQQDAKAVRDILWARINESQRGEAGNTIEFTTQLTKIAELYRDGILSDSEYEAAKQRLLDRGANH